MRVSIFFWGIDVEKWSPFFACFKHPLCLWLLVVLKIPFPVSFGLCWKLALMYFYQKPFRHYADVMSSFTGCLAAARLLWLGYHASPILSNISSTRRISSSTLFYIFSFAWFYEILALSSLFYCVWQDFFMQKHFVCWNPGRSLFCGFGK